MMRRVINWWGYILILVIIGGVYLYSQVKSIYGGDAGDLVSAIITLGIPHPPGYPLYTILGINAVKIFQYSTMAWRVGLVSSISYLIFLLILFDSLFYLTHKKIISLIAVLTLAFTYPIWLYSVTAEVFALNNLITISLIWTFLHLYTEKKQKYLLLSAFLFGLGISHHHIIILLIPALIYLLFKSEIRLTFRLIFKIIILFLTGLTPYLYVFVASKNTPEVNWMGSPNFSNFLTLFTRAGYGTFRIGSFTGFDPLSRILNVWALFDFAFKDFRIAGIVLMMFGIYQAWRKLRRIFWFLTIYLLTYIFFMFYASYPLVDNFLVATFERFVQPLYIILSIFMAFGMWFITDFILDHIPKTLGIHKLSKVLIYMELTFFILPLGVFLINYPKISILKNDLTAENLASDILDTLPQNSILVLSTDTPLFDTQYLYYANKKRPDIKLIHLSKMYTPFYQDTLKKYYPDIKFINTADLDSQKIMTRFILDNYDLFPLYFKQALKIDGGKFIPEGLLFRVYKDQDIPKAEDTLKLNQKLWQSFHNPLSGSLGKYQNLMLSDVIKYYAYAHQEFGFWASNHIYPKEAVEHLVTAEKLYPQDKDSYTILAQVYILDKKCDLADDQLNHLIDLEKNSSEAIYLKAINYSTCYKNKEKAEYYQNLFEKSKQDQEVKLKKL
mgnify:FL=1